VVFTVEAPHALQVQIAGDFNDWKPERTIMKPEGRLWRTTLMLDPGRYRYRYVIDGEWLTDPMNPLVEPSPFSGNDSLLVLEEPPAEVPAARGPMAAASIATDGGEHGAA
jgi:1,4-alpha-glucan branching enzyme